MIAPASKGRSQLEVTAKVSAEGQKEMDDDDRAQIRDRIIATDADRVYDYARTDNMNATAAALSDGPKGVVLTARFSRPDLDANADFNVGSHRKPPDIPAALHPHER